jgi:hypothetical protein
MRGFVRIALTAGALGLTLVLAGCENFDPTAIFDSDLFNTKKPLPGQRRPVFPEGTPGITQGVPPDMVKGYQAPAEDPAAPQTTATAAPKQAAAEPSESKPKPKPKPKQVAKPPEHPTQTAGAAAEQPASPGAPAPASGGWPSSSEARGGVAWPDPPPAR